MTKRNWLGELYAIPGPIVRGQYKDGTPVETSDEVTERDRALYRKMQEEAFK